MNFRHERDGWLSVIPPTRVIWQGFTRGVDQSFYDCTIHVMIYNKFIHVSLEKYHLRILQMLLKATDDVCDKIYMSALSLFTDSLIIVRKTSFTSIQHVYKAINRIYE